MIDEAAVEMLRARCRQMEEQNATVAQRCAAFERAVSQLKAAFTELQVLLTTERRRVLELQQRLAVSQTTDTDVAQQLDTARQRIVALEHQLHWVHTLLPTERERAEVELCRYHLESHTFSEESRQLMRPVWRMIEAMQRLASGLPRFKSP